MWIPLNVQIIRICCLDIKCVDQLARRGLKRPFSSSTEDELAMRTSQATNTTASQTQSHVVSPLISPNGNATDGITLGHRKEQQGNSAGCQPRFSKYSVIGKRGDRLGLGDQLLQLLHQWGQSRQSGLKLLPCYDVACKCACSSADDKIKKNDKKSTYSFNFFLFRGLCLCLFACLFVCRMHVCFALID